jgi:hypothetical protein
MDAVTTTRRLNPNALHAVENGKVVFIEDIRDPRRADVPNRI